MSFSLLDVEDKLFFYKNSDHNNNSIVVNKDAYINDLPEFLDIACIDSLPEFLRISCISTVFH